MALTCDGEIVNDQSLNEITTGRTTAHLLPVGATDLDPAIIIRITTESESDKVGTKVRGRGVLREVVHVSARLAQLGDGVVPRPAGEMVQVQD